MSFIILLTARTDCLPTLRLCSNARACARVHLVLMLECSWPCSRAHVRARLQFVVVFECCRARACARVLVVRRAYDDESHETQAHVRSRAKDSAVEKGGKSVMRLSLGRRSVNLLPVAQRTNVLTQLVCPKKHMSKAQRA